MNGDDVKILAKDTVFRGYLQVDRYRLMHRRHDGAWTGEMVREVLERGHAAAVLPYDPVRDEVVLIEQFRIGAYAAGRPPWELEIIAGLIDAGESADDVARREADEEAGLTLLALETIGDVLLSQGAVSETVKIYCGRVDASAAGGIHGLAEEQEDIKVHVFPFADAARLLDAGRMTNAVGMIALQWLVLNRERLCALWLP